MQHCKSYTLCCKPVNRKRMAHHLSWIVVAMIVLTFGNHAAVTADRSLKQQTGLNDAQIAAIASIQAALNVTTSPSPTTSTTTTTSPSTSTSPTTTSPSTSTSTTTTTSPTTSPTTSTTTATSGTCYYLPLSSGDVVSSFAPEDNENVGTMADFLKANPLRTSGAISKNGTCAAALYTWSVFDTKDPFWFVVYDAVTCSGARAKAQKEYDSQVKDADYMATGFTVSFEYCCYGADWCNRKNIPETFRSSKDTGAVGTIIADVDGNGGGNSTSSSKKLSAGAAAGIAIGCVIVVVAICAAVYIYLKNKAAKVVPNPATVEAPPPPPPPSKTPDAVNQTQVIDL